MRRLLLFAVAGSLACVSAKEFKQSTNVYPPTSKESVLVFKDAGEVGRPYETIGTVYAEGSSGWSKNEGDLVDKIRGRAAKLGANAIILHQFSKDESGSGKWSAGLLGTNDQKLQASAIRWPAAAGATASRGPDGGRGVNKNTSKNAGNEDPITRVSKPMTNEDVLKLVSGGLGEDVILTKIRQGPTAFTMDTDSILQLRKAGVSDEVLRTMLESAR